MPDLDRAIREELANVQRAEFAHSDWVEAGDFDAASEALRAVLKLHTDSLGLCDECTGQEDFQVWPCNTVEAIARELGVKP